MSNTRHSQQIEFSQISIWNILYEYEDLVLKTYKIQLTQKLKPNDYLSDNIVLIELQGNLKLVRSFVKFVKFSYETHFLLNYFVNDQHFQIWANEDRHSILKIPLHPQN